MFPNTFTTDQGYLDGIRMNSRSVWSEYWLRTMYALGSAVGNTFRRTAVSRDRFVTLDQILVRTREVFDPNPADLLEWVPEGLNDDPGVALWFALLLAAEDQVRQVAVRYDRFRELVLSLTTETSPLLNIGRGLVSNADHNDAIGTAFLKLTECGGRLFRDPILGYARFNTEAMRKAIYRSVHNRVRDIPRRRKGPDLHDDLDRNHAARPDRDAPPPGLGSAIDGAVEQLPAADRLLARSVLHHLSEAGARNPLRKPPGAQKLATLVSRPKSDVARVLKALQAELAPLASC